MKIMLANLAFYTCVLLIMTWCSSPAENKVGPIESSIIEEDSSIDFEWIISSIKDEYSGSHVAISVITHDWETASLWDNEYSYFMWNMSQIPYYYAILNVFEKISTESEELITWEEFFNKQQFSYWEFDEKTAWAVASFVHYEVSSIHNSWDHRFFTEVFAKKISDTWIKLNVQNEEEFISEVTNYLTSNTVSFSLEELMTYWVKYSANWPLTFLRNHINDNYWESELILNWHVANNVQELVDWLLGEGNKYIVTGSNKSKQEWVLFNTAKTEEYATVFSELISNTFDSEKEPIQLLGANIIRGSISSENQWSHHIHLDNTDAVYGWWYHEDESMILDDYNRAHWFELANNPSTHFAYTWILENNSYFTIMVSVPDTLWNEILEDKNIEIDSDFWAQSITKVLRDIIQEGMSNK